MTLLTTVFAAIASTIVWYKKAPENEMKVGILCWMYWGASLMWLVDLSILKSEPVFLPPPRSICSTIFFSGFPLLRWVLSYGLLYCL